jgi:hypothetical protein
MLGYKNQIASSQWANWKSLENPRSIDNIWDINPVHPRVINITIDICIKAVHNYFTLRVLALSVLTG